MPRRTLNPSPLQVNNLIAELPERRERITASVKFRDELLKHQERSNYINDYDRLKGLIARSKVRPLESQSVVKFKNRQSDLNKLAKQSLNEPMHDIHKRFFVFLRIIYNNMASTTRSSGLNPVGLHKKATFNELIDHIVNDKDKIVYPNRFAKQ